MWPKNLDGSGIWEVITRWTWRTCVKYSFSVGYLWLLRANWANTCKVAVYLTLFSFRTHISVHHAKKAQHSYPLTPLLACFCSPRRENSFEWTLSSSSPTRRSTACRVDTSLGSPSHRCLCALALPCSDFLVLDLHEEKEKIGRWHGWMRCGCRNNGFVGDSTYIMYQR